MESKIKLMGEIEARRLVRKKAPSTRELLEQIIGLLKEIKELLILSQGGRH